MKQHPTTTSLPFTYLKAKDYTKENLKPISCSGFSKPNPLVEILCSIVAFVAWIVWYYIL